jgi:hypothetical protein
MFFMLHAVCETYIDPVLQPGQLSSPPTKAAVQPLYGIQLADCVACNWLCLAYNWLHLACNWLLDTYGVQLALHGMLCSTTAYVRL